MSRGVSRGRGRGAGRAQAASRSRSSSPEFAGSTRRFSDANEEVDVKPVVDPSAPDGLGISAAAGPSRNAGQQTGTSNGSGGVAALLRKNNYTKNNAAASTSGTAAPKFVPKMEHTGRPPVSSFNRANRGRGRGRGSAPTPQYEMTASGLFSMGPAEAPRIEAEKRKQSRASDVGGASSASRAYDPSDSKSDVKGKAKADPALEKTEISSDDDSGEDDFDDLDYDPEQGLSSRIATVDLDNIHREGEMAPMTLPRDRGKILGSAEQELEQRDAQAQLDSSLAQTAGADIDIDVDVSAKGDAKSQMAEVITGPDVKSGFVFDNEDDAAREHIYILQFPRLFPKFKPSFDTPSILQPRPVQKGNKSQDQVGNSVADSDAMQIDGEEDKKDVKPILEKINKDVFVPGAWQGWGKNGGRAGRDLTELDFEGKIGRMRIRKSGKVEIVLGHGNNKIKYDVLPAAPASFLQEVAVSIPEAMEKPPYLAEERDVAEVIDPGIYVMGQAERKFIVRPNIDQLLDDLAKHKVLEREQVKKEPNVDKDGIEELFARPAIPAAAPNVKRPSSPAKSSSKPKAKVVGKK